MQASNPFSAVEFAPQDTAQLVWKLWISQDAMFAGQPHDAITFNTVQAVKNLLNSGKYESAKTG